MGTDMVEVLVEDMEEDLEVLMEVVAQDIMDEQGQADFLTLDV